jgi:1-deoxy-D-xylulose-5-phosphate reductoisomerase
VNIVVLGSTGSIGENTLEVVRKSLGTPKEIKVVGLTAHSNATRLGEQATEFKVKNTILTQARGSEQQLVDLVTRPEVDTVVVAIVGFAAHNPTLAAIKAGKRIALANKEALITCGELFQSEAEKSGAKIIPVDSEHNSLFQGLQGHPLTNVKQLWITGSGGPFRGRSRQDLQNVTLEETLKHPTWRMGPKITVDSATLMNKGLEFIEARWLFGLTADKIEVIIHRQSLVHGIVEFIDNTMLAHMGVPDMKGAISYALYYPERQPTAIAPLNLVQVEE